MLKAYFEDAGTHDGAPVAVMGGLIGTVEQWDELEKRWDRQLVDPLPEVGKSRLSAFHMADCEASRGSSEIISRQSECWLLIIFGGTLPNVI